MRCMTGLVEKLRPAVGPRVPGGTAGPLENRRLRALLELRPSLAVSGASGAGAVRRGRPCYTRKVVIDRGQAQGVKLGSPVIDEKGVLGQVTRVFFVEQRSHAHYR
jgi:rod shape-determining protein MreC